VFLCSICYLSGVSQHHLHALQHKQQKVFFFQLCMKECTQHLSAANTFAPKVDSWLYLHGKTQKRVAGVSLPNQVVGVGVVCVQGGPRATVQAVFDCNLVLMPRAGTQRTLESRREEVQAVCRCPHRPPCASCRESLRIHVAYVWHVWACVQRMPKWR
jgi:hypothetical protein